MERVEDVGNKREQVHQPRTPQQQQQEQGDGSESDCVINIQDESDEDDYYDD